MGNDQAADFWIALLLLLLILLLLLVERRRAPSLCQRSYISFQSQPALGECLQFAGLPWMPPLPRHCCVQGSGDRQPTNSTHSVATVSGQRRLLRRVLWCGECWFDVRAAQRAARRSLRGGLAGVPETGWGFSGWAATRFMGSLIWSSTWRADERKGRITET